MLLNENDDLPVPDMLSTPVIDLDRFVEYHQSDPIPREEVQKINVHDLIEEIKA